MANRGRPKKPATYAEALQTDKQIKDAAEAFSNARRTLTAQQCNIYSTQYKLRAVFEQQEMIAKALEPVEPPSDDDEERICQRMGYLMDKTMEHMAELARELAKDFDALTIAEQQLESAAEARSKRCQELSDAYTKQCD